jgi:polysaccharide deacetylase family protein (PEP-CTERM system associated)
VLGKEAGAAIGRQTNNLLTFDIEEWYHANYEGQPLSDPGGETHFRANMEELLQICADIGCRATFFTLGTIAERYPDVVRDIVSGGHELASHGYAHELAYRQSYEEFREDVRKSKAILEDTAGCRVIGYRAPSWSIIDSNLHYLLALQEVGMLYDASIFPVQTFLYGIPDAPTVVHHPIVDGRAIELFEVPMSVTRVAGRNVGYSGGFYFRFFPTFFIKQAIRAANRAGGHAIVYLHPREIDPTEQRLTLPAKERFIHYYNVGGTKAKLQSVLRMRGSRFASISEHLREQHGLME